MTTSTRPTLLHLDSSPMGEASVSRALAADFRHQFDAALPGAGVVHRDLAADPLPHLDHDAIMSVFIPAGYRTPAQEDAFLIRDALVEELLSADAVLVSAPMHNWAIPSHLKAWIDQVLVMGRTLVDDGVPNPLAGRPVTVLLSYGGGYTAGAPLHGWDHVEPYLHTVFADALGMDLEVVSAQLTLCQEEPLASLAQASRAAADTAVQQRAREVAGRLVTTAIAA